jgi:hypothetical protein
MAPPETPRIQHIPQLQMSRNLQTRQHNQHHQHLTKVNTEGKHLKTHLILEISVQVFRRCSQQALHLEKQTECQVNINPHRISGEVPARPE